MGKNKIKFAFVFEITHQQYLDGHSLSLSLNYMKFPFI